MAKIILKVRGVEIASQVGEPTRADFAILVNDSPVNFDKHAKLLGMLSVSTIVLSDDNGKLEISIQRNPDNGNPE